MLRIYSTDVGSLITSRVASAPVSATAGGSGDATAVTGLTIDRQALGLPQSAQIAVLCQATLAATKTLSITALKVEDSADGSTWADYMVLSAPGVVATGATGGSTESGQAAASVDLSSARRYVRVAFTPDLSATATDTATLLAAWVFGGFSSLPAPV